MELQLGLALALPDHHSPVKGFDMNVVNRSIEKKKMVGLESKNHQVGNYKRSFDVAFEKSSSTGAGNESKMLALLLWNGQPNEEDDDDKGRKRRSACRSIIKNDDGGNNVVGWPPIKSWRKKMLHGLDQHHQHYPLQNNQMANNYKENENDGSAVANNSMYVKVKMEGVGIVRKIDISLHHSIQTLRDTLITMFSKCKSKVGGSVADYILTYQDKQGDWLLAADVPWQTFIESVQRLQIVRNGG